MPADEPGAPAAAPVEHGTVVLSRAQGGLRDLIRRYVVLIDDTRVGRIGRGETLRLDMPPGEHQLQLKIDWCSSAPLRAVVEAGRTVSFACAPGGDGSEGPVAIVTNKGSYIALWQTPEPTAMAKTPLDGRTRLLMAASAGFFGGAFTFIGAWIWQLTGAPPGVDHALLGASLALTVASVVVFKLCRHRKA